MTRKRKTEARKKRKLKDLDRVQKSTQLDCQNAEGGFNSGDNNVGFNSGGTNTGIYNSGNINTGAFKKK